MQSSEVVTKEQKLEVAKELKKVDIFRDTPVRYLGYANEVGEAFRSWVHVNVVRFSYVVASGYVVADAFHKSEQMYKMPWKTKEERRMKVLLAAVDTLIWQALASVIIPGFTINRICALSAYLIRRSYKWPAPVQKSVVTAIGLGAIPFIIKPIDRGVDHLMESTLRKWTTNKNEIYEEVVRHERP